MHKSQNVHLLVVDPQNDFCDIPDSELPVDPKSLRAGTPSPLFHPSLPVAGADSDMRRLAAFIDRAGNRLTKIYVTLDSHNPLDIAHPTWWMNARGESPPPFTVITVEDLRNGSWTSRDPLVHAKSVKYVESLEARSRYRLVVWPEHCLVGSWGHNVHAAVKNSLDSWVRKNLHVLDFVMKGSNPFTEHYSALQAEVPDPSDASTLLNDRLVKALADADLVLIGGEALSHCVANTVRDIASNAGEGILEKVVLLTDCSSPVAGFENLGAQFIAEATSQGMRTANSADIHFSML